MAGDWRRSACGACLAAVIAAAGGDTACAGAWTLPEGHGRIIFSPTLMLAKQRFDRRGKTGPAARFVKSESVTLIEYGWRDDVTLMLTTRQRVEGFTLNGDPQRVSTATLGAGARVTVWRGERAVLSVQGAFESGLERSLPVLDRRHGARHEADARLLGGWGFDAFGLDAFVDVQAGYRWRSGRHADEAVLDASLGVRPHPNVLILLQLFNAVGLQRDGAGGGRMRRHKLQASAVIDLTERWSVQAGAFFAPVGRGTLREQGVVLGIWRKF
jgi:hypothetical protein